MTPPIRVILAEDHQLVRAGLCALIRALDGILVVGEASNGKAAVELIQSCRPHVVLMDISMPGLNGLEAASRIIRTYPKVRVAILSMHTDREYVLAALRAGASGYLIKDSGADELEMAIRAIAKGETFLSPAVSGHVIQDYLNRREFSVNPLDRLTPRQREILQLVAEGLTTKEIAVRLNLSVKTVDTHRTQLMDRLDIHDVAGLVRLAVSQGIV